LGEIDMALDDPFDAIAIAAFDEAQTKFAR
jgi:hypothetical protein